MRALSVRLRRLRTLILLFSALTLALACRSAPVTVLNDTEMDVTLFSCEFLNPVDVLSGSSRIVHPASACIIDVRGTYIGCLLIPQEALDFDTIIRVSDMITGISDSDCVHFKPGESR